MKILVVFAAVILAANAANDSELWLEFKHKYGVNYKNLRVEQKRYSIFKDNLRKIEAHNEKYERGETTYYMGVTLFADVTHEEFVALFDKNENQTARTQFDSLDISDVSVPTEKDWRTSGVVSEVKMQGNCGGCWSFSATGAMESAYAIKTGKLVSLSEQQLIDCTKEIGNHGCSGGTMHRAFNYASQYGVELETDYPYIETDGTSCAYEASKSVVSLSGYKTVQSGSETALKAAVGTIGPVSVSIDADYYQLYSGGILDEAACTTTVNHGVLVVGYGTENGVPYWLIKNSWGADWGEDGYVKMVRDKNDQCGIALYGVYPVV